MCGGPSHRLPLPPSLQWLKDPGPRTEKRTLCCDVVCFLFITPLAAISGWLCLRGAQDHLRLHSHLEALGLIALTIALFTIYVLWTLVSGSQQASGSRQVRGLGSDLDGAGVGDGAALCLPGLVAGPWGGSNSQHLMELQIPGRFEVPGAKREASARGMQDHRITSAECRPH